MSTPHSRACGYRPHPHGLDCAPDCPSCGTRRPQPEGVELRERTPESLAAWLLEADADKLLIACRMLLEQGKLAHRCFLENHDGLRDELHVLRQLIASQGWRRDPHGYAVCACDHLEQEHRHDLKTSSPCHVGGCDCQQLDPVATRWREHRTVTTALPARLDPCPHHPNTAPPAASDASPGTST